MIQIPYSAMVITISILWVIVRAIVCFKKKQFSLRRELQLLLVYVCFIVVARFTFFPFEKADGKIQPLLFDAANAFPFRINAIPFTNLFDYPDKRSVLLNLIGNTTMFIPIGVIWPVVYKELNTHTRVILAGVGFSLFIEILQLPFFDRVTDINDLILNSVGFLIGYGIYLLFTKKKRA